MAGENFKMEGVGGKSSQMSLVMEEEQRLRSREEDKKEKEIP